MNTPTVTVASDASNGSGFHACSMPPPSLWSIDWTSSKPTQIGFEMFGYPIMVCPGSRRDSPCLQSDFRNLLPQGMGISNATKRFVLWTISC